MDRRRATGAGQAKGEKKLDAQRRRCGHFSFRVLVVYFVNPNFSEFVVVIG
ncbi:MAG TPA: hypothetical protein VK692_04725 [Chthoniobacterales bacterium]|jgi:hypothetical protein|nr:hypothetical protein [Chthoniobacterales bacterium]